MIPLANVRAMLAAATPGPWRREREDGTIGSSVVVDAHDDQVADATGQAPMRDPARRLVHEVQRANAALIAAAPDLAAQVLTLAAALETAQRERDAYRERDAFLTRERIAVATALDVPYATLLGEAVALRLARLTAERDTALASADLSARAAVDAARELGHVAAAAVAERDAARSAHAELAAAVRAEREAERGHAAVRADDASRGRHLRAAEAAVDKARHATDALLSAAPAPTTVPAEVVRAYLRADARSATGTHADATALAAARTALDAALAGCA